MTSPPLNYKVLAILAASVGTLGLVLGIVLFTVNETKYKPDFGIVLDAGSSHTGLILYKWSGEKKHCTGLVEQVAECEASGGIAQIDPSNMSLYLDNCFDQMSSKITTNKSVPVYMGATAGMRILELSNPDKVKQIFDSFSSYLTSKLNFDLKQASIISGSDEGLFAWVTANHLLDNLLPKSSQETPPTTAMLDMGGASAQIAFEVTDTLEPSDHVTTLRLYGVNRTVKATSNLCFGVDQARLRHWSLIRLATGPTTELIDPCMPKGSQVNLSRSELETKCTEMKPPRDLPFEEDIYTIVGSSNPGQCKQLVNELVDKTQCDKTFEICHQLETQFNSSSSPIVALSSYFYTSSILKLSNGGTILKSDFTNQSDQYCDLDLNGAMTFSDTIVPKYITIYCFQLKFIQATLDTIYNVTGDWSNIKFSRSIGTSTLGWSLGLMINATNAIPSESFEESLIGEVPFSFVTVACLAILGLAIWFFVQMRKASHEPLNDTNAS